MFKFFPYLILFLTAFACKKNVEFTTTTQNLEAFDRIDLGTGFEVYLTQDSSSSIDIVAAKSRQEHINITLENGVLKIRDNKKNKFLNPHKNEIKLYISTPTYRELIAAEGCSIYSTAEIESAEFGVILKGKAAQANLKLNTAVFYCWNNFPTGGRITLTGKTDILKVWNTALMMVDAKGLTTTTALLENKAKGDIIVTVFNELKYTIQSAGNIEVYGNPNFIFESEPSTSTGKLILK